jgi:hypothetical protein
MEDIPLPPELAEDPLSRLARRKASDEKLAAITKQVDACKDELATCNIEIAKREKKLRTLADANQSTRTQAVIFAIIVTTAAFVVFFISSFISRSLVDRALDDQRYATYLRERQQNAEFGARRHTFGAHFDSVPNGWFIDFPNGTILQVTKVNSLPAVQIFPHGR